jgi:hypothetical protein
MKNRLYILEKALYIRIGCGGGGPPPPPQKSYGKSRRNAKERWSVSIRACKSEGASTSSATKTVVYRNPLPHTGECRNQHSSYRIFDRIPLVLFQIFT